MDPVTGGLISAGVNFVGGLFGDRAKRKAAQKARKQQLEDIKLAGVRSREAAILGGFNPLTYLGATGGTPQVASDAVAPLASIEAITGGLRGMADEWTGVAAQQRARDKLQDDLTRVQIDNLRGIIKTRAANQEIAPRAPRMGRQAVPVAPVSTGVGPMRPLQSQDWIDPRREVDNTPVVSDPGMLRVDSPHLPSFAIPAIDGEPMGIDELLVAAPTAMPQITYKTAKEVSRRRPKEIRAMPWQSQLLIGANQVLRHYAPKLWNELREW